MAVDEDAPDPDIDDLDATDAADQRVQDLADDRAWVETCLSVVRECLQETACSDPVRSGLDSLALTAMARVKRILRSDLRNGSGSGK